MQPLHQTHRLSPSVSVTNGAAPAWRRVPEAAAAAVAAATASGTPSEEALLGAPLVLCRTMSVISLMAAKEEWQLVVNSQFISLLQLA